MNRYLFGVLREYPSMISQDDNLQRRILSGRPDVNIRFDDLRSFLLRLGFVERVWGKSSYLPGREESAERINLQRDGSHAKPYQVRQVRQVALRRQLAERD